jgi:hypothetical protein
MSTEISAWNTFKDPLPLSQQKHRILNRRHHGVVTCAACKKSFDYDAELQRIKADPNAVLQRYWNDYDDQYACSPECIYAACTIAM